MDNIKPSDVPLSVHNDTRPTHIAPSSDHNNVSGVKFDKVSDLSLFEIIFNGIVSLNSGIRITNRASIVGDDMGNGARANSYSANF